MGERLAETETAGRHAAPPGGGRAAVSRRHLLAGAAALAGAPALGLLATACGGPGGTRTDAAPSGKLAPAKIRYLHNDRHRDDAYARVWKEFSAQHPGVEVELNVNTGGSYVEKLTAMLVSGDAPDAFPLERTQVEQFIQQGGLLDLTPLVKRDARQARWSDLLPTLQAEYTIGGKIWEFPSGPVNVGMYFNKDELAKHGLAAPKDGWTWDDLLTYARRLQQADAGNVTQWGLGWLNANYQPWVWGAGGEAFDKPFEMTKCLLDEPKALAGIQWYADLVNRHRLAPRPSEYSGIAVFEMFYKSPVRFPLALSGSWRASVAIANAQFAWDVVALPRGPVGKDVNITWSGGFSIHKASNVIEQTWALLLATYGPERDREEVMQTGTNVRGNLPNYATTIKDAEVDKGLTKLAQAGTVPPGYARVFFNTLLSSKQQPVLPATTAVTEANRSLNAALTQVWEGQRSPSEAMKAVVPPMNAALTTK